MRGIIIHILTIFLAFLCDLCERQLFQYDSFITVTFYR